MSIRKYSSLDIRNIGVVSFLLHIFQGDESQSGGVHAIPLAPSIGRTIIEHMPQMIIGIPAPYLGTSAEESVIYFLDDRRTLDRPDETRPPSTAVIFILR